MAFTAEVDGEFSGELRQWSGLRAALESMVRWSMAGGGKPGARAAVILNAAAALLVGDLVPDYASAVTRAREALDGGAGAGALERLRGAYR